MANSTHIKQACQAINHNGFEDYYYNLVNYFAQNTQDNLSYPEFSHRTNRATKALTCEKEAIFYTVAYARQHYLNLQYLLGQTANLSTKKAGKPVNLRVIDYGCGQGVATMALMDFMAQKNIAKGSHLSIYLIEPSKVSIGIAKFLIERLAAVHEMTVDIHMQQCNLANAKLPMVDDCTETVHLMLNILDIIEVQQSLFGLTNKMGQIAGSHTLFACSPVYQSTEMGFWRLQQAMQPYGIGIHYNQSIKRVCNIYRITQACWAYHSSKQRMLAMSW